MNEKNIQIMSVLELKRFVIDPHGLFCSEASGYRLWLKMNSMAEDIVQNNGLIGNPNPNSLSSR